MAALCEECKVVVIPKGTHRICYECFQELDFADDKCEAEYEKMLEEEE